MVEQIIEGVSPTRMDLLDTRKKLVLAEEGHKLLEEKRDTLVEKFFDLIDERNRILEEIDRDFRDAFLSLIESQMILGEEKVKELSHLVEYIGEVELKHENLVGVKILKIDKKDIKSKVKPIYGFFETCSKLDDAQKHFASIVVKLVDLADLEGKIKGLSVEIEKTKRRVNVLENNIIPRLRATIKYIEMQLEEREREDFFRRKRIKAIMESKNEHR